LIQKTYSPPKQERLATSLNASNVISKGLLSPPTISQNLASPPPENLHKYEEIKSKIVETCTILKAFKEAKTAVKETH